MKMKKIKNFIACDEVKNITEFLKDKFCSLRITKHDGEPITGAETIILNRFLIFNDPMKYSITCKPDVNDIVDKIKSLKNKEIDPKGSIYYFEKYKLKNFEKITNILFNICGLKEITNINKINHLDYIKNQNINLNILTDFYVEYIVIESNQYGSTPGIIIFLNLEKDKIYYITLFGYSHFTHKIYWQSRNFGR